MVAVSWLIELPLSELRTLLLSWKGAERAELPCGMDRASEHYHYALFAHSITSLRTKMLAAAAI